MPLLAPPDPDDVAHEANRERGQYIKYESPQRAVSRQQILACSGVPNM